MRRTGRRGQRGFTLLELLITLSVTTIGLIGLLALHLSIARGNDGAGRAAEAEQITTAALESLRAQSVTNMLSTLASTTTANTTVYGRNNLPYNVARTSTVLNQASTSLLLVRVQTTWAEEGAAIGSAGAPLNHSIALEVIRTMEEQL